MAFFEYKARNSRGELVEGILEGADSSAIATQLFNSGVTPVHIKETRRKTARQETGWWARLFEPGISSLDVQLFSRQIFTLIKAGVPIMRALSGLQASATNTAFARVIQSLRESLDSGRELSAAMRQHPKVFAPFYLSMVTVGEVSGRLEEVFLKLFDQMEFERDMKQRVKSALRYPMFVLIAMTVAIAIVNIWVIPAFAKVFAGFNTQLPLMTRILIGTSDFFVDYKFSLLGCLVGAVMLFRMYIASPGGRYTWDRFKLRIPIVGKIILKGSLARLCSSFSIAGKSGVPIIQAFHVVAQTVDNVYIARRVEQMRDSIERGESILRAATTAGVFTPVVLQMIAVGEETGMLDDLMAEVSQMYERELDYELKTLASQIEPLLIVALGVLVLILALGIFLPLWDLSSVMLKK
ncbi:MAG: type II secretion system F family protein [Oxalobacter sp.]|nr:MAG: type II secretion system F family protein [Oxalobacter sp.]